MFCKNCGEQYYSDESIMCVKCGAPKGQGQNYCATCGNPVQPNSFVCSSCGVPIQGGNVQLKSKVAAGLLGIFLGAFGVHNFYLGYTTKAIIQLVATIVGMVTSCIGIGVFICVGIEIWGFVEGIMILTGNINKDGKGLPLQN